MKDYSVIAIFKGAERTYHLRGYTPQDALDQVDKAYQGQMGYEGTILATECARLPGADVLPPASRERPGIYPISDRAYWGYMEDNLRCYASIDAGSLANALKAIIEEGRHTPSQIEAISVVIEDAISNTSTAS